MNVSRLTSVGQKTVGGCARRRAAPLFLLLLAPLCFCRPCRAATRTEPVTLSHLRDNGVTLRTQMRFDVRKIELAGEDVSRLLKVTRAGQRTWWKHFAETTINISVTAENVAALQAALDASTKKELRVTLLDEWADVWRRVPWSDDEEFHKREHDIPVETKCDEITNIFYGEINSLFERELRREAAGSTAEPVNINAVFGELVKGKLDDYLQTLGPVRKDARCQTTFELLKWLKGDEASGFASGKYRLRDDLKGLLETTIKAVERVNADWSRYDLGVRVAGYTDLDPVRESRPLTPNQTGVYWGSVKDPPDVYYGGCRGDHLDPAAGDKVYIDFAAGGGEPASTISNNCQLGAARAYVATVYLFNRFGLSNVSYSYATGGVHPKSDPKNKAAYAEQRKIDIVFTVKAARTVR